MEKKIYSPKIMNNPAIYAMEVFQAEMKEEGEKNNLFTDSDINALIYEIRNDIENPIAPTPPAYYNKTK